MTRTQLLKELESLSHSQRMRRMVEIGRVARGDAVLQKVLAELRSGGVYERCLALQACYGTRDAESALAALLDPSRLVRAVALKLLPEVADDEQMRRALQSELPAYLLAVLIRALSRRRRYAPIDAQLATWLTQGDARADKLLAFASPAFIQTRLPLALEAGLTFQGLMRLAQRAPAILAEVLRQRAVDAKDDEARLLSWVATALPAISDRQPHAALELVKQLEPHYSLAQLPLQTLACRLPNEVADLAIAHRDRVAVDFCPVAERLDERRRSALLLTQRHTLPLAIQWFRRLSPEARTLAYRQFQNGWRDSNGALPVPLLRYLAREDRIREARAHLRNPALANHTWQLAAYAGFLPWDEALATLQPLLRSPEGDVRGAALGALVGALRYERQRASELLTILLARKNEQDPVRLAFLAALAGLPAAVWRDEHLEALGAILRQTLDAADISHGTAMQAQLLLVKLLPHHATWAVTWLATFAKERGQFYLGALDTQLTDDDVRRIAPALLPVLKAWNTRERQPQLLGLAVSLGCRLKVFPELVAIVGEIAKNATNWVASQALGVIHAQVRRAFGPLALKLLASDPSWITIHFVYNYLHLRRQDLLTPALLGRAAYRGKFATGQTRFVLPLYNGFGRWTPTQQATFTTTLEEVTHDGLRDAPAKLLAVRQLAAMPEVASKRVQELAALENKELIVRDTALRALADFDGGQGVPVLLSAMGDDRARIAIYALRRALLSMPAAMALSQLRQVPTDKVTVAKEVVRLIGELRSDDAYAELLAWNEKQLHRDVRIALLRACWDHVHREPTWNILAQAAASPDSAIAKIVGRIPVDGWSESLHRRYTQLLATLLSHPDATVRCEVMQGIQTDSLVDTECALVPPLLDSLSSAIVEEVHFAARVALGVYRAQSPSPLSSIFQALVPQRQALAIVVQTLAELLQARPGSLRPALDAALSVLESDPLTIELRVRLAAEGLRGADLASYLRSVAGELHADALALAISVVSRQHRSDSPFVPMNDSPDLAALSALESQLAASSDERLRRLALAALQAQATGSLGWSEALRARLETYRQDASVLVAGAATFTFPPPLVEVPAETKF